MDAAPEATAFETPSDGELGLEPPAQDMMLYQAKVDGTPYPGLTLDAIARWIQEGRLLESDEVAPDGTEDYRNAVDFPEIKPYFDQFFGTQTAAKPEPKKKGFLGRLFSFK